MSNQAVFKLTILKDIDPNVFKDFKNRAEAIKKKINVGVPTGATTGDGIATAGIAAIHEYGAPEKGIPERPFLRAAIQENAKKYGQLSRQSLAAVLKNKMSAEQALGQIGEVATGDVKERITKGPFAPLKPATINRKGSSKPLIDTGSLRQSIVWEIAHD